MAKKTAALRVVAEDTQPLPFTFKNKDLSIYSAIDLEVTRQDGTTFTRAATIVDAATGKFEMPRLTTDFPEGTHEMDTRFTLLVGGTDFTIPSAAPLTVISRARVGP
jgi:hypothetical protein